MPRGGARLRVLYVDDDAVAREFVARGLKKHGFEVDVVGTLAEGRERAREGPYKVLILDVSLPDGEGFDLLAELRDGGSDTPALFLTSRGSVADRLRGFEQGGDDYLPKPFALSELAARLQAIGRRHLSAEPDGKLRVGDLELDIRSARVERAGQVIELSPKPLALLECLMSRAGQVVTRDEMIEAAWGPGADVRPNALEVQINAVRKRVDHPFPSALIHTRSGLGYVLEER